MKQDDFTHAFAVPGKHSMIDLIHPNTGRSLHFGETLEEVRKRYPDAQRVNLDDWRHERAAAQDTPITWAETTEEQHDTMLNVLPPAFWRGGLFLVGEPMDHHATTDEPRFTAYWKRGSRYFVASRPITRREAAGALNQIGTIEPAADCTNESDSPENTPFLATR